MLLQVVLPPLRSDNGIIAFNTKLEKYDNDLAAWRRGEEKNFNKEMREAMATLDLDGGLLWDLLTKLVVFNPSKRLTADAALRHPALSAANPILSSISTAASQMGQSMEELLI